MCGDRSGSYLGFSHDQVHFIETIMILMRESNMRHTVLMALSASLVLAGCDSPASEDDDNSPYLDDIETVTETVDPAPILAALGSPWSEANLENGRRIYRQCQSCHTLYEDGRHLMGPNLYGLMGRTAGSAEDFRYSQVLQDADFIWDAEQLDQWLADPRGFLPGNRMSYPGLADETQRRDVIGYIAVETDSE